MLRYLDRSSCESASKCDWRPPTRSSNASRSRWRLRSIRKNMRRPRVACSILGLMARPASTAHSPAWTSAAEASHAPEQ